MAGLTAQSFLEKAAGLAGIQFNGRNAWDPQIHDERFYQRVMLEGRVGLGDSYIDGWWDCTELDVLFTKLLENNVDKWIKFNPVSLVAVTNALVRNLQTRERAWTVSRKHYDLGNDVFKAMLGSQMIYTGAPLKEGMSLEEAQLRKLESACEHLNLRPGQKVLDVGCGFGGVAKYLAEVHGVEVTGITLSKEQAAYARDFVAGLPVEIVVLDYRDLPKYFRAYFDSIVTLGMIEHVGRKNHSLYFRSMDYVLKRNGRLMLQTILKTYNSRGFDPWLEKHIFPNSYLPTDSEMNGMTYAWYSSFFEDRFAVVRGKYGFGHGYDRVCMEWRKRFRQAWPQLKKSGRYDERFYRLFIYYLSYCAAFFRSERGDLCQYTFEKYV